MPLELKQTGDFADDDIVRRKAELGAKLLLQALLLDPNVNSIINAEKIKVTGSKARTKPYDWYTYHPGGRKVIPYDVMIKKHPTRPIELAVRRMLPKSPLGRSMLTKLKAYAGPDHPHEAQQPQVYKKA